MPPLPQARDGPLPRVITYYQTHHTPDGRFISILPVLSQPGGVGVTHVILAALHINADPQGYTLNDHPPSHPRFTTLWAELRVLQASGVKVMCMLGGAARGSYERLDGGADRFERYWCPVRDLIREHGLDGIDLDVEEDMSMAGMVRLVDRIRADFGQSFIISLAPVAAAMLDPRRNLSGFDYAELEMRRGPSIDFYNAQFYNGWGDAATPLMYEMMLRLGWPARKIVVGLITNPENGNGWVPWEALSVVLPVLRGRHPDFGGVMGWEYFNSLPAGRERPWEWATWMSNLMAVSPVHHVGDSGGQDDTHQVLGAGAGTNKDGERLQKVLAREADPDSAGSKDAPVPDAFEYYDSDEEPAQE